MENIKVGTILQSKENNTIYLVREIREDTVLAQLCVFVDESKEVFVPVRGVMMYLYKNGVTDNYNIIGESEEC